MKKLLLLALVVVAVIAAPKVYREARNRLAADAARQRVNMILQGMAKGDSIGEQTALCMWAEGAYVMDMEKMAHYLPKWQEFWSRAGFQPPEAWEIVSLDPAESGEHVDVTVGSRDHERVLRVVKDQPITLVR